MFELRKSSDRGISHLDWLYSQHTFSFSNYYDPKQQGFSDLLVINEDRVTAHSGFGTHPHKNMEIFSYVIEGALSHKDSMGNGSIIYPGDVQMMSAGTGILHSEMNPLIDQDVHFLQIWIVPDKKSVKPRYQQKHFDDREKRGKLRMIISPDGAEQSLSVYQDIRVYAALLDADEEITFLASENRYFYVHVVLGTLELNGYVLEAGDGLRIRNEQLLNFSKGVNAEILLFDMRPNEQPLPLG